MPVTEISDQGEIEFRGVVVYELTAMGECKELARTAMDSRTTLELGIGHVGKLFFLLTVGSDWFQAWRLNIWSPVF